MRDNYMHMGMVCNIEVESNVYNGHHAHTK